MSEPRQRVLVTGANGFIGSALVRELLGAGYPVRALVRASSNRDNLEGLELETVSGDIRDPASLGRAVQGCHGVFHLAADYRLWTPNRSAIEAMYASNVQGTRNVLQAAAHAGVARVVYTSSVATLGMHADATPADEDTPVALDDMIGHYKRSKYLADQAVRELAADIDTQVVSVHPAAPVGPRDRKPTPTGRMVLDAARGRMPVYVDTGLDIVHVADVAAGHRLAYEQGAPGRHFILGGDNLSLRQILEHIAAIRGHHPPWMRIPHAITLPPAWLAETRARLSGRPPSITLAGVRLARKHMYFSHQRASDELGYRPRPAQQALADAVQWFADNGRL